MLFEYIRVGISSSVRRFVPKDIDINDEAKHNNLPLIVQPLHLLGPNKDVIVVFDLILAVRVERYRYNRYH